MCVLCFFVPSCLCFAVWISGFNWIFDFYLSVFMFIFVLFAPFLSVLLLGNTWVGNWIFDRYVRVCVCVCLDDFSSTRIHV